jgi:hypothetical protein
MSSRSPRYLYLPSTAGPEALAQFWRALRPVETLVVAGDEDITSTIPVDAVHRSLENGVTILHYVTHT